MKKLFFLIYSICLIAQVPPDTEWTRTYGSAFDDYGYSIYTTMDKGYIIAGALGSAHLGYFDALLLKTDSLGNTIWVDTLGDPSYPEKVYSVIQTGDSGFVSVGYYNSPSDVWLIKIDKSGNLLWQKGFGGADEDKGYYIKQTSDKGYIITGYTFSYGAGNSDVYLLKTDSLGNVLWEKTYGDTGYEVGWCVDETEDGGYVVAGWTKTNFSDVYLLKTDGSGNLLWEKTFGGYYDDHAYYVMQTQDKGYIIVGERDTAGSGLWDVYLIKTDSLGNVEWEKTYGGQNSEYGRCVLELPDQGYIVTGGTNSFGAGSFDVFLFKIDTNGNIVWEKTVGGVEDEKSYYITHSSDNGFAVVGWTRSFGSGGSDVFLIKFSSQTLISETHNVKVERRKNVSLNLFMKKRTLYVKISNQEFGVPYRLSIYNSIGRLVSRKVICVSRENEIVIPFLFPSGIYFVSLTSSQNNLRKNFKIWVKQ